MRITQAKTIVKAAIENNLNNAGGSHSSYIVPMLWSLPGVGKSTVISDTLKEMGLQEQQIIVAQFDAGEMGGFPFLEGNTYKRARPFFMPTEGTGAIVCDELPQAPGANQNIIAQLAQERCIGEHKLPEGWTVICAGNPMSAKAGTTAMPSHLKDRMVHLDVEANIEDFRGYALSKGFLPEVTSYLFERPEWLQKFDPKVNCSPSPRSWERANQVLTLGLPTHERDLMLQGIIGEGGVADFTGYLRVWKDLPKVDDIVKDPKGLKIPEDPSVLYALCSSIAHRANKSNVKALVTYLDRFKNKEFTAFAVKDILSRNKELLNEPSVSQWFFSTGKALLL